MEKEQINPKVSRWKEIIKIRAEKNQIESIKTLRTWAWWPIGPSIQEARQEDHLSLGT
jgi:hypothetical protein